MEPAYTSSSEPAVPFSWTIEGVLAWLVSHASTISQGCSLDPSANLFEQGFDRYGSRTSENIMISRQVCSLSATFLRNRVVNALRKAPDIRIRDPISLISPNIVFEHPSLRHLAARIASLVGEPGVSQSLNLRERHVAAIDAMIEKYSVGIPGSALSMVNGVRKDVVSHLTGAVVLLTGSTGGLGSFLLSQLLLNPSVERVYAVNRPCSSTSIEERQKSAFVDKGLCVDLSSFKKLIYIEADVSQDNCGLSPELYLEVRDCSAAAAVAMFTHAFSFETR